MINFVEWFCEGSIYLYLIPYPYDDGFNLGMLEAMRMGHASHYVRTPHLPHPTR